jgi:hypothetical protein
MIGVRIRRTSYIFPNFWKRKLKSLQFLENTGNSFMYLWAFEGILVACVLRK